MYFGTDGIRAKDNFFTEDFLEKFAFALYSKFGATKMCIGRDTRVSGGHIAGILGGYLIKYGVKIFDCGILPTPALAFLTKRNNCEVGIMISASHNPPEYNGIKLFSGKGAKISEKVEKGLEELISRPLGPKMGREGKICLADSSEYEEELIALFKGKLEGMRLLIDACYGATAGIAKRVFKGLGCKVDSINDERKGEYINVKCGATDLTQILEGEKRGKYDLAFAYDGDGDRVICVKGGKIYNGDHICYAYSRYLEEKNDLNPRVVVGTLTSNLGIERALENRNIDFVRANVGDRQVYEKMQERGAKIGGESSGHVIFKEYGETGDGILTSIIACIMEKERGLESLIDMVDYPLEERWVYAEEKEKDLFLESDLIKNRLKEIEDDNVRVVVRASGTEPKIRILVEGERYETAREKCEEIVQLINSIIYKNTKKENTKPINLVTQNTIFDKSNYEYYISQGVTIISPETTFIEEGVQIGEGSVIYPFNVIRGKTKIGKRVTIYSYCDLTDTIIGDGSDVRFSYSMQAEIGENATIGPFATLRKGAKIGNGCRIGDYVEIKNSVLGDGVKAAHLSYVGDATIGAKTNVGCGTVFANYNGKVKRKTEVGEGVFIGCNANLIAPLKIGDNSYIAGGATITEDVPKDKFVIARVCQKVVDKRKDKN